MSGDITSRILEELGRCFRVAGPGSMKRVEEQLGLGAGYFKDQRRSRHQRYDLVVLLETLKCLGVDARYFFALVVGPGNAAERFKVEAAKLRKRSKREPRILRIEKKRGSAGGPGVQAEEFAELEELRYESPDQVLVRAKSMLLRVSDAQVAHLLGLYASACRVAGRLREGHIVLGRALELAERHKDVSGTADLLLRAGYVVGDAGDFEQARALAEQAATYFMTAHDLIGLGKACVDHGIWLGCLNRNAEALHSLQSALGYFPPEQLGLRKSIVSCHLSIAITYQRLGNLEAAKDAATEAESLARGVGSSLLGKVVFFKASIARQNNDMESAAEYLKEAFENFEPIAPLDAAMTGVELVQVQLEQGQSHEAYITAKGMMALVGRLENHPLTCAALTELIRCALTGRGLSLTLLERTTKLLTQDRRKRRGRKS